MNYSPKQLADLASISVRTLHFYDEIGLLKPALIEQNGYRKYGEKELLRLQQILFFRELDFTLDQIRKIMSHKTFDVTKALHEQKKLIEIKRERLEKLIKTLTKTIKKMDTHQPKLMTDEELFEGFTQGEMEAYKKEAAERWGNTNAYKQSQERVSKLTKEDKIRIQREQEDILSDIINHMDSGIQNAEVQAAIGRYHQYMNNFYDCSTTMFRGLGSMYIDDPRFTAFYEKRKKGLALFMRDAMHYYCDKKEAAV